MMMYKRILLGGVFAIVLFGQKENGGTDWPVFGHDPGAKRFSPLKQINVGNIARLQHAWTFHTGKPGSEGIPIVVGGVMYLAAANGLFAIEPETGKQIWHYEATQVALRGWPIGPETRRRIPRVFAGVKGGMVAVDAITGKPATGFANEGLLDLKQGVLGDLARRSPLTAVASYCVQEHRHHRKRQW